MIFVPYEIETLEQETPWMNWFFVAVCSVVSLMAMFGGMSYEAEEMLVLEGWKISGLFGHILLHGGLMHLIGNMIFLWVFGNAICTNIGNGWYAGLFLLMTLVAATVHNVMDGMPAIGASGAINGIVGVVLAMYPVNRVYVFWFFMIKGGTFPMRAWILILVWLGFDLYGVMIGGGMTAYWAHIGGLFGGLAVGLLCLHLRWFMLTEHDNRSLLEMIKGEYPE